MFSIQCCLFSYEYRIDRVSGGAALGFRLINYMATQVKMWTMEANFAISEFYNKVKVFQRNVRFT